MNIIIGSDSSRYAQQITYAIISVMEHHRGSLTAFDHEAYCEIVDRAREARTALEAHGNEGIPLAALLIDRSAEVYRDDTGAEHLGLCRIAAELRGFTREPAWADAPERIMEERAHLFALAGGE